MLIVIGGLPGVGKSTVSQLLCKSLRASYLRVDTIENALLDSGSIPESGHLVAYAVAAEQLRMGATVVAECVNALDNVRSRWRLVAEREAVDLLEVELICSDQNEHRQRVEHRTVDIAGHKLPTWVDVRQRTWEPWPQEHLIVDTSQSSPQQSVDRIRGSLRA